MDLRLLTPQVRAACSPGDQPTVWWSQDEQGNPRNPITFFLAINFIKLFLHQHKEESNGSRTDLSGNFCFMLLFQHLLSLPIWITQGSHNISTWGNIWRASYTSVILCSSDKSLLSVLAVILLWNWGNELAGTESCGVLLMTTHRWGFWKQRMATQARKHCWDSAAILAV